MDSNQGGTKGRIPCSIVFFPLTHIINWCSVSHFSWPGVVHSLLHICILMTYAHTLTTKIIHITYILYWFRLRPTPWNDARIHSKRYITVGRSTTRKSSTRGIRRRYCLVFWSRTPSSGSGGTKNHFRRPGNGPGTIGSRHARRGGSITTRCHRATVQLWYHAQLHLQGENSQTTTPWKYIFIDSEVPNAFVMEVLPQRFFITTGMVRSCVHWRVCVCFLSHTFWCCSLDSFSFGWNWYLLLLFGLSILVYVYICTYVYVSYIYICI